MKSCLMAFLLAVGGTLNALPDVLFPVEPTSLMWERYFDGSSQDVASAAVILPSGDIVMVGLSVTERSVDLSQWHPFSTNTASLTDVKLVDPAAVGNVQTQYRTRDVTPGR